MGFFIPDRGFQIHRACDAGSENSPLPKKTVQEWTRDLKGKPVEAANEIIVADGTDESYEAFAQLYQGTHARPAGARLAPPAIAAWWHGTRAVLINTAAGYRAFLAQYPDSDLTISRPQA